MKPTHTAILIAALLSSTIPIASAAAASPEGLRGLVTRRVAAEYPSLLGIYTKLHAHPELSCLQMKTVALVAGELHRGERTLIMTRDF